MNDTWQLTATDVEAVVNDDEDTTYLFLSGSTEAGRGYFSICRIGDGKVEVERDDQQFSCDEGIENVVVRRGEFLVVLNQQGTASLGGPSTLRICLGEKVLSCFEQVKRLLQELIHPERLIIEA